MSQSSTRASTTVIHSARIVTGGSVVRNGWVRFERGTVAAIGRGATWEPAESVVDADGAWLMPGFIDIHCHGGGGAAFDDGDSAVRIALDLHERHGTTRAVVSLVTAPVDVLAERVASIARLTREDPRVLGSHLEGPFLDIRHKGAHNHALLRPPRTDDLEVLLSAAQGTLRQITIAPELPGGLAAVTTMAGSGVAVAVGHTAADYSQTLEAFARGATILTHAFNAMDGIHHRAPGPIMAATSTPGVTVEVINDGTHVHPEVVRLLFAAAPGRVALITDAMGATGSGDGDYVLGTLPVRVRHGIARLADSGAIAGSTLTLDEALRRAVQDVGVPVEDAVRALTEVPATAVGVGHAFGQLAPGFAADAVVLDRTYRVMAVWRDGIRLNTES